MPCGCIDFDHVGAAVRTMENRTDTEFPSLSWVGTLDMESDYGDVLGSEDRPGVDG